ncbi:hypothetical protein EIN_309990 [Entamoeba invadens IP1]|uniref:Sulfotransferase n=1 Tax=Entamoeba invadens IP1 TaxID=370355 RepID=A0A0A1TWE7_ENTIV|nr:hypothetical protein EIN_309990 [Entamoeba invadens IP1]ELP84966.1 hypothetical protein EIN_309990 [Entamoeba invadens IP1]|eukprot:XP_004184312.1 hypothetical protein EIN_309990 [Entamoeba invadens IP1]
MSTPFQLQSLYSKVLAGAIDFLKSMDTTYASLYDTFSTQLSDVIDSDFFHKLFSYYLEGYPNLSPDLQAIYFRASCVEMATRLRILMESKIYNENPNKPKLHCPLFVISFPRSGSTFLHNLLLADPTSKGMKFYQVLAPGGQTTSLDGRYKYVATTIFQMTSVNSDFSNLHKMAINTPEEETFMLDALGLSFIRLCSMSRLNQLREHFDEIDWSYGYTLLKDMMCATAIEDNVPSESHFCMKSVQHFVYMKELLTTFPNGKFLWIHRNPRDSFKSLLPVFNQVRMTFMESNTQEALLEFNKTVLTCLSKYLRRALEVRKTFCEQHIVDRNAIRRYVIYKKLEMEMTPKMEENMKILLQDDSKKKHGTSQNSESLCLLSDAEIDSAFIFYTTQFRAYLE